MQIYIYLDGWNILEKEIQSSEFRTTNNRVHTDNAVNYMQRGSVDVQKGEEPILTGNVDVQ